jgi:hypothetical protein
MSIRNRNLHKAVRVRRTAPVHVDISTDSNNLTVLLLDNERHIKITKVLLHYTIITDTGSHRVFNVGTLADDDAFFTGTTLDSTAAGTVVDCTPLLSTSLPAGTALVFTTATGAGTNTGEFDVVVEYEVLDRLR